MGPREGLCDGPALGARAIAESPSCLACGNRVASRRLPDSTLLWKRRFHPHPNPPPEGRDLGREKDFAMVLPWGPGPFDCSLSFQGRIGRGRSPVDLQTAQMQVFTPTLTLPLRGRGFGAAEGLCNGPALGARAFELMGKRPYLRGWTGSGRRGKQPSVRAISRSRQSGPSVRAVSPGRQFGPEELSG